MDTLAPLALLARTLATLQHLAYPDGVHQQDPDQLITAKLQATASRHAGWTRPKGQARDRAVAELRDIATVTEKTRHGSVHQPRSTLRTDLLAEIAGTLIGFAPDDHPQHNLIAADLLREAGADEEVVQQWVPVGRKRREGGGPAFSAAEPIGFARPPRREQGTA